MKVRNELNQGEFWTNRSGARVPIEDMSLAYRANCAVFLLKHARTLKSKYDFLYISCPDDTVWEFFDRETPVDFIRGTELFKALVKPIDKPSHLVGELVFDQEVEELPQMRALVPDYRRKSVYDSDGWTLIDEEITYYKVRANECCSTPVNLLWEIDKLSAKVGKLYGSIYGYGIEDKGFLWRTRDGDFELEIGKVNYG